MAGTILEAPQAETIIVGELFACLDATPGIELNALAHDRCRTVQHTTVIEKSGRIPRHAPVDIIIMTGNCD